MSALNEDRWAGYKHGSDQREYLASLEAWCKAEGADLRVELAQELFRQQSSNRELIDGYESMRQSVTRLAKELREARKAA